MALPFTADEFLGVFRAYNEAIWPAHIVAYALGFAAVFAAVRGGRRASALVAGALALFWAWNGLAYHVGFFAAINPVAYVFGCAFVLQAIFFTYFAFRHGRLAFRFRRDGYGLAGAVLVAYAAVLYPLLGVALGHGYPYNPAFGLAPCPTTIFTFGLLLWTDPPVPKLVLVIPALWALVGSTAALRLGIAEDVGLLVAALATVGLLLYRDRRRRTLAMA
jgi:hypothetical protein